MKPIDQDWVPSLIAEAVDAFYNCLEEADHRYIKRNSEFVAATHHSIGQALRNTWSLWEHDTPLKRDFVAQTGLWGQGDDVSGYIITKVARRVRGESEDCSALIEDWKQHWTDQGIDYTTGEPLNS